MARFTFEAPAELARFIAEKGSVALDGTSLTVNDVDGARFDVMIIPHTLAVTTWGERQAGRPRQPRGRPLRALCRAAAERHGADGTSSALSASPAMAQTGCRMPRRTSSSSRRASTTTSPTSCVRGAIAALDARRRDHRAHHRARRRSRFRRRSPWRSTREPQLRRLRAARLRHPRRDDPLRHRRRANPRAPSWTSPSTSRLAVGNGILTVENDEQAWARARDRRARTRAAARREAALAMIALKAQFGAAMS